MNFICKFNSLLPYMSQRITWQQIYDMPQGSLKLIMLQNTAKYTFMYCLQHYYVHLLTSFI